MDSYILYRVKSIVWPQKVTFSGTSGEVIQPSPCRGCSVFCDWTGKQAVRLISPAARKQAVNCFVLILSLMLIDYCDSCLN